MELGCSWTLTRLAVWPAVTIVILFAGAGARGALADEPKTAQDEVADREFAIAAPEISHINGVLGTEMSRLLGGGSGTQSPEVTKYLNASLIDLDDTRIPLHTRFIERQRREFVAGIAMTKSATAGHCTNPNPGLDQLLDPGIRAQVLAAIKCHQRAMDLYQSGTHNVNQAYEAMLLEMKLPPNTLQRMLARAHASTLRQDADLVSSYAKQRELLQANMDFYTYLDAHAAQARYAKGGLVFEDPADTREMQNLAARVAAATQSP